MKKKIIRMRDLGEGVMDVVRESGNWQVIEMLSHIKMKYSREINCNLIKISRMIK